jgi:hypothetical protein
MVDQLRNGRVTELTTAMGDIKVSIGEINVKLGHIVLAIEELKDCHEEAQRCLNALNLDLASRPSADSIRIGLNKVERHETYFMIIGGAITIISVKVMGWVDKFF